MMARRVQAADDRPPPLDEWVVGYSFDRSRPPPLQDDERRSSARPTPGEPLSDSSSSGPDREDPEQDEGPPGGWSDGCNEEEQSMVARLSRKPSRDTLWIDMMSNPAEPASKLFMRSLLREEVRGFARKPMPAIRETVGFAMPSIAQGSLLGSVFTLVASAMGAGCLSLPHMLCRSGLGLGLVLLFCGALLAHLSLVVLMSCARYTECTSFAELVALSYRARERCSRTPSPGAGHIPGGRTMGSGRGAALAVDVVISFYGVAAVLIYMMLIGDFFRGIALSPALGWASATRGPLILSSLLVVFPLSLPRHVSALRYVCLLSTGSILFMSIVVLARMPTFVLERQGGDSAESVLWVSGDLRANLQSFGIAIFAFAAHTNAVPTVAVLEGPRAVRIWQVSLLSVMVEFVIYSMIAVGGYLCFLGETQQDFIRNYPTDDTLMLVVRCVYSVPVVFGVPINLSPAAASLQTLLRRWASGRCAGGAGARTRLFRRLLGGGGCDEVALHFMIVFVVLTTCAVVAIWCEAVADVIGLLGSFFGTLICLWWPHRVYSSVLSKLHSQGLALLIGAVLMMATALGAFAFLIQVRDFLG